MTILTLIYAIHDENICLSRDSNDCWLAGLSGWRLDIMRANVCNITWICLPFFFIIAIVVKCISKFDPNVWRTHCKCLVCCCRQLSRSDVQVVRGDTSTTFWTDICKLPPLLPSVSKFDVLFSTSTPMSNLGFHAQSFKAMPWMESRKNQFD